MTENEANTILDRTNFLLKNFPFEEAKFANNKISRRKPHLRAKHIFNRKVFFDIFKQKYNGINKRDKARRYEVILYLRDIFKNEIPNRKGNSFVYTTSKNHKSFILVVKNIKRRNNYELYLYSIYPI